ncbi:MAG: hypothetical protein V3R91_00375 [Myxococcota bacterium]
MARITPIAKSELSPRLRKRIEADEAAGRNPELNAVLAHLPEFFDQYFEWFTPGHERGVVDARIKELARLKIARLNDCPT